MKTSAQHPRDAPTRVRLSSIALAGVGSVVAGVLILQILRTGGSPDPLAPRIDMGARVLDIAVLVFREGLECVLVLAAVTANMVGRRSRYRGPVAAGVAVACVASLATWGFTIGLVDSLGQSVPALDIQAATGLLAIVVLLVVMNWFFHKVYWTGWISMHSRKKQDLMKAADGGDPWSGKVVWGLALLGFSSVYREGFEVVLFLQSYRLKLGGTPIAYGVASGLTLTAVVAALTFVAHRRLPYRRMLVLTGVLLGLVLLVMAGEQAQEMQLANWLPTTPIRPLERLLPSWLGLWFAVFPTVETLIAQAIAAAVVLGSYVLAGRQLGASMQAERA